MRVQDYSPPKLTLGVVGVIAIIIPILLGYFLVSGMATSKCYEGLCGSTTSSTTSASGHTSVVKVSIPVGAGLQSGAPGYAPDNITLIIGVNNTVVWTNNDGTTPHTVTSTSVPAGAASFDSGNMNGGAAFNTTLTVPGVYKYHCNYHSWMTGEIVVKGSSGPTSVNVSIPVGAGLQSGAPGYAPDNMTVVIGVNNTVVWTNNDGTTPHTVTSTSVPAGAASFDSGNMNGGAAFNTTLTVPGVYKYHCNYHSWMTGTITVLPGTSSAASSSSSSSSSSTSSSASVTIPANATQVSIPSGAGVGQSAAPGYAPDNITVVIGMNNTVAWTNNDNVDHTVTSTTIPSGASSFDSGLIAPGASFVEVFTVPGVYHYHCTIHSWMSGTVTVVQGP